MAHTPIAKPCRTAQDTTGTSCQEGARAARLGVMTRTGQRTAASWRAK